MCGFTGIWNLSGERINMAKLIAMNNSIRHRGPDDEGYLFLNTANGDLLNCAGEDTMPGLKKSLAAIDHGFNADLGVGFRRLSIMDLSELGHQPMSDVSLRYWIVFNGEIYNFPEIRSELTAIGYRFHSGTDTEVILNAYLQWGEECLHKFNGMWAFAIYDKLLKSLFCSRDRFGIKPFYYYYNPGIIFAFASEIKALLKVVKFEPEDMAVSDYFMKGITCHSNLTFFRNILQLMPGHKINIDKTCFSISKYYSVSFNKTSLSFSEAKVEFAELLNDSVLLRQRSDVPFGYALSGGIDSSSIVCTARNQKKIESDLTFSLIFPGSRVDESEYIKEVINKTGFQSRFLTVSADDLNNDLEKFILHQEEPFGGISYYGEFKLRELIKNNNVTVSLEGQGADEIVTGYRSLMPFYYFDLLKSCRFKKLSRDVNVFKNPGAEDLTSVIRAYLSFRVKRGLNSDPSKYPYINSSFLNSASQTTKGNSDQAYRSDSYLNDELYRLLTISSIPEQLARADKSAMAFSVESRFPFLDYRLVELTMNLPYDFKINEGRTKYILREAMKNCLPEKIYNRIDKIGFAVPSENWVNENLWGKLIDYFHSVNSGFVDKELFQKIYTDKSKIDWKFWKVMSYIIWLYEFNLQGTKSFIE